MKMTVQQIIQANEEIQLIGKSLNEWMKGKPSIEINATSNAFRNLQGLIRELKTVEVKVS